VRMNNHIGIEIRSKLLGSSEEYWAMSVKLDPVKLIM